MTLGGKELINCPFYLNASGKNQAKRAKPSLGSANEYPKNNDPNQNWHSQSSDMASENIV